MKVGASMSGDSVGYLTGRVKDTGYTKICPGAAGCRGGDNPKVIGKERELEVEWCEAHVGQREKVMKYRVGIANAYYETKKRYRAKKKVSQRPKENQ